MPDIELRFNRDTLVLSAPIDAVLTNQGFDPALDIPYMALMEPDSLVEGLRMEIAAGAQCLVLPTRGFTTARLAHARMEDDLSRLVQAVCAIARELVPQHLLIEIGPCGLPLDPSSKSSLNENRRQYAEVARAFSSEPLDAFFLEGFTSISDLKCALMGVAQISSKPIFASVMVQDSGLLMDGKTEFLEAVEVMEDLGASVIGFETVEPLANAVAYAKQAVARTRLPILAQLRVKQRNPRQGGPTTENPYYCADAMEQVAVQLMGAGVQFLRATGNAAPSYTGALVATSYGVDVKAR